MENQHRVKYMKNNGLSNFMVKDQIPDVETTLTTRLGMPSICSRKESCWWKIYRQMESQISTNDLHGLFWLTLVRCTSCTPQWNVAIDDWFATWSTSVDDLPDFNDYEWRKTFGAHTYHFPEEPGEEAELDRQMKPTKSIKQEHHHLAEYPQMEEIPLYTPPPISYSRKLLDQCSATASHK